MTPPPLAKSWEQFGFFKMQMGMEMDSSVSHLTIVHVRVLIPPKKNEFEAI